MNRAPLTSALATMLGQFTGWQVGMMGVPSDTTTPYLVLFPIEGGAYTGPNMDGATTDADCVYQITTVAERPDQAEQAADRVRGVLLDRVGSNPLRDLTTNPVDGWAHPLTCAGLTVADRRPQTPPIVLRDDLLFTVAERFVLSVVGG